MKDMTNVKTLLTAEELQQVWADLAYDEHTPEFYELTEHGEVVMSPRPETRHQRLCTQIAVQIQAQLGGEAVVEAAVLTTTAGVRVPDVVWMPEKDWQTQSGKNELLQSPKIVVEVLSPGNREAEMNHKVQAYLASGVQEVILVGLTGSIDFFRINGSHTSSQFNLKLSLPSHLFR